MPNKKFVVRSAVILLTSFLGFGFFHFLINFIDRIRIRNDEFFWLSLTNFSVVLFSIIVVFRAYSKKKYIGMVYFPIVGFKFAVYGLLWFWLVSKSQYFSIHLITSALVLTIGIIFWMVKLLEQEEKS